MARQRVTESAVKFVRGMSNGSKILLAAAATIGTLYGAIQFIVRYEFERFERERQKIGRQEFKSYKERIEKELDQINSKLEKLDDKVDEFHK